LKRVATTGSERRDDRDLLAVTINSTRPLKYRVSRAAINDAQAALPISRTVLIGIGIAGIVIWALSSRSRRQSTASGL
jgi:hypothetical protein